MNKKMKILIGTIMTLLVIFASIIGLFSQNFFNLNFIIHYNNYNITINLNSLFSMLSVCLGLMSVINKRKIWLYSSIIIAVGGVGALGAIGGYLHPNTVYPSGVTFLNDFFYTFFENIAHTLVAIIAGPILIYSYGLMASTTNIILNLFVNYTSVYGIKGSLFLLGWLHIYFEIPATFLACLAGIRVGLKSFEDLIQIRKNGVKNTFKKIGSTIFYELKRTMPKVIVLLLIAAILETVWTPFWTNYWLYHIL